MAEQIFSLQNDSFIWEWSKTRRGLISLRRTNDVYDTNYLRTADPDVFGNVILRWKDLDGHVQEWASRSAEAQFIQDEKEITAIFHPTAEVELRETWHFVNDEFQWEIAFKNQGDSSVTIADIELPLAMNQEYVKDTLTTYTQRVVRHGYCALDGSFYYWCRPNGIGPMLVMVPDAGTAIEYYTRDWTKERSAWEGPFSVFLHSAIKGEETPGVWKYPHTSLKLEAGEEKRYCFQLSWAKDHQNVRDVLYRLGGIDAVVVPGMTVSRDMTVKIALRSKEPIRTVSLTKKGVVSPIGEKNGYFLYELSFLETGENFVEIRFGEDRYTRLEFFLTHSISKLLKSRAKHLVKHQQYRGAKWYNGLFSQWDMQTQQFITPDNQMGLYRYITGGADDPGLCKAPFLAEKNLIYPQAEEVEALEYYIDHFLWGGQQRTDQEEPRAYGIYGTDFWIEQRNAGMGINNGGHGEDRMWRTFDYTHIAMLYYYMYRIAESYPQMVHSLNAAAYLERAYRTAMAFYQIPISIWMDDKWAIQGYSDWAYKQGNFHELVIPKIVDALEKNDRHEEAKRLRDEWETKVKYMVYDHPYPFGSEMWFDSTAFESTHAVAKYGLEHEIQPDQEGFFDPNANGPGKGARLSAHTHICQEDFRDFMERELLANRAARGMIEPTFELMGSDYRQAGNSNYVLSYMTQLGGWGLLDAALYAPVMQEADMRIGYASFLAGWALIHTGDDYPWYPGNQNKGAAGWGFEPAKHGSPWIGQAFANDRGPWRIDGEIDSGFSGGIRMASCALVEDSIFGVFFYGGRLEKKQDEWRLLPADGVQQVIYILLPERKLHLSIDKDGLREVRLRKNELILQIENRTSDAHKLTLTLTGDINRDVILTIPAQKLSEQCVILQDIDMAH